MASENSSAEQISTARIRKLGDAEPKRAVERAHLAGHLIGAVRSYSKQTHTRSKVKHFLDKLLHSLSCPKETKTPRMAALLG